MEYRTNYTSSYSWEIWNDLGRGGFGDYESCISCFFIDFSSINLYFHLCLGNLKNQPIKSRNQNVRLWCFGSANSSWSKFALNGESQKYCSIQWTRGWREGQIRVVSALNLSPKKWCGRLDGNAISLNCRLAVHEINFSVQTIQIMQWQTLHRKHTKRCCVLR